jgi:WD40 repeat protein
VESASFSHNGYSVLTLSKDGSARLHRFNAFEIPVAGPAEHQYRDNHITADGHRRLVVSRYPPVIEIWDLDRREPLRLEQMASAPVHTSLSPDGRYVFSVGTGGRYLWSAENGELLRHTPRRETDSNRYQPGGDGVFSQSGSRLVARNDSGATVLWEPGEQSALAMLDPHGAITTATFSEDGAYLVTAGDGITAIWDAGNGLPVADPATRWQGGNFIVSADGARIAVQERRQISLWARDGSLLTTLDGHDKEPRVLLFSPDGTKLLSVDDAGVARLWDAVDGRPLHEFAILSDDLSRLAVFSDDSRHLLLGAADTSMVHRIFDTRTGRPVAELKGHRYPVVSADFSPTGQRVVTGSVDGTARLWDVGTGVELVKLGGDSELTREPNPFEPQKPPTGGFGPDLSIFDSTILRVGFSKTGDHIYTLQRSGRIRLFRVPDVGEMMSMARQELKRPLGPEERERYFLDPHP